MVVVGDVNIELYGRVELAPGGRTPVGPTLPMAWTEVGSGLENHASRPKKMPRFSRDVDDNKWS